LSDSTIGSQVISKDLKTARDEYHAIIERHKIEIKNAKDQIQASIIMECFVDQSTSEDESLLTANELEEKKRLEEEAKDIIFDSHIAAGSQQSLEDSVVQYKQNNKIRKENIQERIKYDEWFKNYEKYEKKFHLSLQEKSDLDENAKKRYGSQSLFIPSGAKMSDLQPPLDSDKSEDSFSEISTEGIEVAAEVQKKEFNKWLDENQDATRDQKIKAGLAFWRKYNPHGSESDEKEERERLKKLFPPDK